MSEQPEQFVIEQEESMDLHCKVGDRYPSHRRHTAAAQDRTLLEAAVEADKANGSEF